MASSVRISDGSLDFSLGVDSGRVTTVQSPANPNGLPRQMLAWASNATVRSGSIRPRPGWNYLTTIAPPTAGLYQGGWLYEQPTGNPYLMVQIGGFIYQIRTDEANQVVQLTVPGQLDVNNAPLANPPTILQAYFCQAEQFLIIQPGDWQQNVAGTLPLFWDGATIRRSVGIIGPNNTPTGGVLPLNEIPSALAMTYFQDRVFYANGRSYSGGDIIDGPSGSAAYNLDDSVLKVTENPLSVGGDGFTVPSQAGEHHGALLHGATGCGTGPGESLHLHAAAGQFAGGAGEPGGVDFNREYGGDSHGQHAAATGGVDAVWGERRPVHSARERRFVLWVAGAGHPQPDGGDAVFRAMGQCADFAERAAGDELHAEHPAGDADGD